jgi:hypothetical protein
LAVGLLAFVGLLIQVAVSPGPLVYDEGPYLDNVALLDKHGLSVGFLRDFSGSAGPTFTSVHYLLMPMTHLTPPAVRLVNPVLLLLTVASTYGTLRFVRQIPMFAPPRNTEFEQAALDIVGVPMIWVVAGLALTEMPAMFLASLSILLLLHVQRGGRCSWLSMALGGLAWGLAIMGRQPFLVVLGAVPLLAGVKKGNRRELALYMGAAAALPAFVFAVWGGLIPPEETVYYATRSLAIDHGLLALAYAGVICLLLAPGYLKVPWKVALAVFLLPSVLNAVFQWVTVFPMETAMTRLLPGPLHGCYRQVASVALVGLAGIYLTATVWRMLERRQDRFYLFLSAAALLVLITCIKVTAQFSSRYAVQAAPLLILILAYHGRPSVWKATRLALGAGLGSISLWSYLS